MDVLILARDSAWHGGVVNFAQQLIRNLPRGVLASQFVIGRRKGSKSPIARSMIPVIDCFRLWRHVRAKRYDVYHINPSLNLKSLARDGLFLWVLRLTGARNILVSFHGWNIDTQRLISRCLPLRFLFKVTFGISRRILVLAPQFAAWLVEIKVAPEHGICQFTTMFDDEQFIGLVRAHSDSSIRLLFLSRLVREKGIYELLGAVAAIRKAGFDVSLTCAGDGPELGGVKKWVDANGLAGTISTPGYLRGSHKGQTLLNADVFVLPSYSEGCPVAMLEAMAAGLPIVATSVGGIPKIICDGYNGVLLEVADPSAIASAIIGLIEQPELLKTMGERNYSEAWEKYTAPVVARQFESFYRECAGDG